MKVKLLLCDGREMTFSEVERISILEEYSKSTVTETVQKPTEGKWFKVNPLSINQNLFKEERADKRQEEIRQLILEAFEEMKKDSKYAKTFMTMMPEKTWSTKSVLEQKELAKELGDHNADWVEQALEWAQRIANGEEWITICNKPDTANWYRLVVWKNGYCRYIGGSAEKEIYPAIYLPASDISDEEYDDNVYNYITVPLVVRYR